MTTNTQGNPASAGGNLIILLGAPSHDELTEYTSKLLEGLPALGAPTLLCKFDAPLTYDQLLVQKSVNPTGKSVMLLFCGHGVDSALQGPGVSPGMPNYSKARSPFYDDSHIQLGPKFLLAFCCYAANKLGDAYERKTTGGTFVGFEDKIFFVMGDGDYADCWKEVLHGTALAMLNAPDLPALEKAVRDIYKAALLTFSPEEDAKYEWGLYMRAYLRRQLEDITFIKT